MAKLHIANCTQQNHHIYYRLDVMADGERSSIQRFNPPKKSPLIKAGQQIVLGGDLHPNQVTELIDQLNRFGMAGVADLPRLGGVTQWLFNIDVPVTSSQIRSVMQHNAGVLARDGRQRREAAAVAAGHVVQAAGIDDHIETKKFEVTVEQIEDENTSGPLIGEGYKVASRIEDVPQARNKGGRPRKVA